MGIECPRCGSIKTVAKATGKMFCENCAYSWRPYKHRGKKMKPIGDGIIYPKRRVMPGAKTTTVGDGIIWPKKRVKKTRRKRSIFGI